MGASCGDKTISKVVRKDLRLRTSYLLANDIMMRRALKAAALLNILKHETELIVRLNTVLQLHSYEERPLTK